jgi:hypothetical protein
VYLLFSCGLQIPARRAAASGLEVSPASPEVLSEIVDAGFHKVEPIHRPAAIANILRLIAVTLEIAETQGDKMLHEGNVMAARDKLCPIYPFGK